MNATAVARAQSKAVKILQKVGSKINTSSMNQEELDLFSDINNPNNVSYIDKN